MSKQAVITVGDESEFSCGAYHGLPEYIIDLDLAFLNLEFIKLHSGKFFSRMQSLEGTDWSLKSDSSFNRLSRQTTQPIYVAFPIDKTKEVDDNVFQNLETFLQIMFPSHFKLVLEVGFAKANEKGLYRECYSWDRTGAINQHFVHWNKGLEYDTDLNQEIIDFLKLLFLRYDSLKKDYEILFACYQNSFYQWSLDMAFVNLTMSLESLIGAQNEIAHQIARTVAIINSSNKEQGRIIYNNLKKLYGLRSKIVHGDKPKNNFKPYYLSLKALVSRTIIEVVILNLKKDKLGELIIESGYGERNSLIKDYQSPIINKDVLTRLYVPLENLK